MATIVLRNTKGAPLTNQEVDDNFNNLNVELGTKVNTTTYTAADVLTKLKTVDGLGSGLDADLLDGLTSSSTLVVSTIVARDASGNFAANTITANLTGNVTGNVSGTAGNITGVAAVINGGTGSSTAAGARTNLGLGIGTDVQPYDGDLSAIAGLATAGIIARTGTNTAAIRTITGTVGQVVVSNGDGVSGNPTIDVGTNIPKLNAYNAFLSTSAIKVPTGTSAQRSTGALGDFRFNSEMNIFEGFNSSGWGAIGGAVGGATDKIFYENDTVITTSYTLPSTKNAQSTGPLTLQAGAVITINSGSVWAVI